MDAGNQTRNWNWARTHQFEAERTHRPTTIEQLSTLISDVGQIEGATLHGIGTRHSFSSIADADQIIDTSALPETCSISADRSSVTVSAGMTYSRLCELLAEPGLALANLASLPHISVAGAISTATHGSGDRVGNLATAVRSMEIATADGEVSAISRADPDFAGFPISLGALGIITAVELDVEPEYEIEQHVHDDLSWDPVISGFDAIFGAAYSVSVFTDWRSHVQLWTKRRTDEPAIDHGALHDGQRATERRHPVPGEDASACTGQAVAASWSQRLPHFRAGAIPSVGAEVQSEFFVDREHAVAAIKALRSIGDELAPSLMASEIRTVHRDDLWLSPQYGRDCVAFHFTWHHDLDLATNAARTVAAALAPFSALPHWGKIFDASQFDLAQLYPRLSDVRRLHTACDPHQRFRTPWVRAILGEETSR